MNDQKLANSFTCISNSPPGTMIYDAVKIGTSDFKTAFLIRESPSHLDLRREKIQIEILNGLIIEDDVALIPLLIQLNKNPSLTYRCWLNYHESDITKQCLNLLTTQELLYLFLFTGGTLSSRGFTIPNNLQSGFRSYAQQIMDMVPWSTVDFDCLKSKVLRKRPALSMWYEFKIKIEGV
jgi:hypothetical protein